MVSADELKFIIACGLGAVVRVLRTDGATLKRKMAEVISGFCVAYYFGSGIVNYHGVDGALAASLGFVVGLVSMELTGILMSSISAVTPKMVGDVVRHRLGMPTRGEDDPDNK